MSRAEEYLRRMKALGYEPSLAGMDDADIEWELAKMDGGREMTTPLPGRTVYRPVDAGLAARILRMFGQPYDESAIPRGQEFYLNGWDDGTTVQPLSADASGDDQKFQFGGTLQSGFQGPNPPKTQLQDNFPANQKPAQGIPFTYIDKDGNQVTTKWTISDEEFQNSKALTQDQITSICSKENPELVKRGFDTAIYQCSQKAGINPKVLLATLAQEQGWCRNGGYEQAFGVGPGGEPGSFDDGGLAESVKAYSQWFNKGRAYNGKLPEETFNQDRADKQERKAVLGDETTAWEAKYPQYARYIDEGIRIKPVNAAMYARLHYTPWVDFPPQESQPLKAWHDIFRSF